ncbi:MAG: HEPN domain-containing protein [Deltaproteobacteria bacterium]|nr:HEPN domain-containing protein [Deltaproteobacteria bacterium]
MKGDENNALIEHRIARATDTIEEVSFLIKNKKLLLAVNRIYYGMFYILSALSLRYDFSTSKHQQLIGWFNKEFISSGEIDRRYGRILHNAYNNRSTGDYDDFAEFDEKDVKKSFDEMKDFIKTIRVLL